MRLLRARRLRSLGGALLLTLLAISLGANVALYRRAMRPLYEESDRSLIERTLTAAANSQRADRETVRAATFPIVVRLGSQTCVELRYTGGEGYQSACYN